MDMVRLIYGRLWNSKDVVDRFWHPGLVLQRAVQVVIKHYWAYSLLVAMVTKLSHMTYIIKTKLCVKIGR